MIEFIGTCVISVALFLSGYYYCKWRILERLRKFIGEDIPFLTVLNIVNNINPRAEAMARLKAALKEKP